VTRGKGKEEGRGKRRRHKVGPGNWQDIRQFFSIIANRDSFLSFNIAEGRRGRKLSVPIFSKVDGVHKKGFGEVGQAREPL
jgi:hypothetical protein